MTHSTAHTITHSAMNRTTLYAPMHLIIEREAHKKFNSVQCFRFRVMMGEMAYAITSLEAVRLLKPKRIKPAVMSLSYLDCKPSRYR